MKSPRRVSQILADDAEMVLTRARRDLDRSHSMHYEREGPDVASLQLATLYRHVVEVVASRRSQPLVRYITGVARQRHCAGFDLWELQTAFNVLEEAMWHQLRSKLPPREFADAIGLLSAALGTGKDALARTYVELARAPRTGPETVETVEPLFRGTEGM